MMVLRYYAVGHGDGSRVLCGEDCASSRFVTGKIRGGRRRVASPRFELGSGDPESPMIDHYTTRLSRLPILSLLIILFRDSFLSQVFFDL